MLDVRLFSNSNVERTTLNVQWKSPSPRLTPALALARASIAREIIRKMNAAGLNQSELARRSGVPRETLNRILRCTRTPDEKTVSKIEKALRS